MILVQKKKNNIFDKIIIIFFVGIVKLNCMFNDC